MFHRVNFNSDTDVGESDDDFWDEQSHVSVEVEVDLECTTENNYNPQANVKSTKDSKSLNFNYNQVEEPNNIDHSLMLERQQPETVYLNVDHLYKPGLPGSMLTWTETVLLIEATLRGQPVLGIRLLCPRYDISLYS